MARITLDNVARTYPLARRSPRVEALRGLSLDVGDGEYVTILGPSGCGKTTALRLIAGLDPPTGGSIRIGGRDVAGVPPRDRGVAMVFQGYCLYPHMTVRENLALAPRLAGVPRARVDERVREAAESLGISDVLDRRPGELSGGQRQRAALARCLARQAGALLLDEPLSNLDAPLRARARDDLRSIHRREGTTTIHVTHDQEEAMTLGDRVAVMSRGRLEQAGPPLEVYHRPANRFVAGFVGSPAMNFVEGRLERNGGLVFVESGAGGARITIPPAVESRFERAGDSAIVLGFRPRMLVEPDEVKLAPGHAPLAIRVRAVEPLGDALDVHGTTAGGARIVARLAPREGIGPGQNLTLALDLVAAHVFEAGEFGRRLSPDGDR